MIWLTLTLAQAQPVIVAGGPDNPFKKQRLTTPAVPSGKEGSTARCVVLVEVNEKGKVDSAQAYGCDLRHKQSAESALRTSRFSKPVLDGLPARGRALVDVTFVNAPATVPPVSSQCDYHLDVSKAGKLTFAPFDPALPCAAAAPEPFPPPPDGAMDCTVEFEPPASDSAKRTVPNTDACDEGVRDWIADLVARSQFAKAKWTSLWIAFEGSPPPLPEPKAPPEEAEPAMDTP